MISFNPHKKIFPAFFLFVFQLLVFTHPSPAQEGKVHIGRQYDGLAWGEFLERMEKNRQVRIFYNGESRANSVVSVDRDGMSLERVLEENLPPRFRISKDNQGNYFILEQRSIITSLPGELFRSSRQVTVSKDTAQPGKKEKEGEQIKTYKKYISRKVTVGSREERDLLDEAVVRGYVTSAEEEETLPHAILKVEELNKHVTTNSYGYYSMELSPGEYTLTVSSMGSYEKKFKLTVYSSGELNISLRPKPYQIGEAVVSAKRHHNVRTTQMGMEKIEAQKVKAMPVVMGEQDIVKVALMLPGIQTVSEVSSGFNVRGSPADQNIFYVDDLPVYNVSHLFGLFSAFNPDAVDEFTLYKSNIPLRYGGRLSSIFEIDTKDGSRKEFGARGGISPVTSRFVAEGPLFKGKSSYLVGVRSTYSDWVLDLINDPVVRNSRASFRDGMAKFTFHPDSSNIFKLFAYGSQDRSDLTIGTENDYSNYGASISWKHLFNDKDQMEFSLVNTNYTFTKKNSTIAYLASRQSFDLTHSEARLSFSHQLNGRHDIQYGINSVLYQLERGDFLPLNEESNLTPLSFEPEKGIRNSLFLSEEWEISPKLTLKGGIRGTLYSYLGPKTVFHYLDGEPRETRNIIDTTSYANNEAIQHYTNLNYRVAGKYQLSDDLSIKASYNKLHQYIYRLSNNISVNPTDYWKLASSHIRPMEGVQYSAGIYKNFMDDRIEASIEAYHKSVDRLVQFEDGAMFTTNQIPETDIIQGDLDAFGIELMIRKKVGKFNGWLNYTFSSADIQAINEVTGEENNRGEPYPANYEKPHALNMTLNYKLTKRLSISANMVYSTGRPVTFPDKVYYLNGMQITGFSGRNEYRLPDYFRTDLSIQIEGNLKKNKLAHGSWNISFYNITGRNNPYSVYFKNEEGNINGYKLSIFGAMIPSITYNLKLGNYAD